MNYSTNYSMREPVPGEKVKVADINYNTEIIDGVMLDNRQISIDMYDDTSTYNTDDLAGHENAQNRIAVYRCLEDNVTGPWDSTKWVQTNLADEITDIRGNAGASALEDLTDVDITNPTDGQALLYDPNTAKWHNSDLPDADVTKEASGNPIEFEDGADAPLVKCVTEIQGSQDLHGYSKPWVGGAGINKLPPMVDGVYEGNGAKAVVTNGVATFSGTTTAAGNALIIPLAEPVTVSENMYIHLLNSDANGSLAPSFEDSSNPSGTAVAYSLTSVNRIVPCGISNVQWNRIRFYIVSGITLSGTFSPMLCLDNTSRNYSPYSNICPITAYTEGEIEVRGKNMLNPNSAISYGSGSSTYSVSGNAINVTTSGQYSGIVFDKELPNGTYSISFSFKFNNSGTASVAIMDEDNNTSLWTTGEFSSDTTRSGNFTVTHGIAHIRFYCTRSNAIGNVTISNLMLNKGSSAENYEEFRETTHTTTYPSAIYRGSEDVVNGSVEYDWVKKSNISFTGVTKQGNNYRFEVALQSKGDSICSHFPADIRVVSNPVGISFDAIWAWTGGQLFFISTPNGTNLKTVNEANSYFSNNNIEIAYKLAPTTSSVTPTNLPIKSLSGYNHIESSTGEMEIEYFPAKEQPLIDLIPEASNMHEYSTEEHAVGTWIDGETIYEKTIYCNGLSGTSDWTELDSSVAYGKLISANGIRVTTNECFSFNNGLNLDPRFQTKTDNKLYYYTNSSVPGDIYITIRYTKTSSNNRSLAKSAPQEEQVEELKEEPIEETKEEVKEEPEEPVEEVKEEVKEEETKEEGEVNER